MENIVKGRFKSDEKGLAHDPPRCLERVSWHRSDRGCRIELVGTKKATAVPPKMVGCSFGK